MESTLDRLAPAPAPSAKSFQEFSNLEAVFDGGATQKEVYDSVCNPVLEAVKDGCNAAVVCYGQTGSGE